MNYILYVIDDIKYRKTGWFGCQLESYEWRRVKAGTTRKIDLIFEDYTTELRVFTTGKRSLKHWFKVHTTWTIPLYGTIENQSNKIQEFYAALKEL